MTQVVYYISGWNRVKISGHKSVFFKRSNCLWWNKHTFSQSKMAAVQTSKLGNKNVWMALFEWTSKALRKIVLQVHERSTNYEPWWKRTNINNSKDISRYIYRQQLCSIVLKRKHTNWHVRLVSVLFRAFETNYILIEILIDFLPIILSTLQKQNS